MNSSALIIFTVLLAGCQAGVMLRSDDTSPVRVTGVKLLQPLTIAPDTTRVFVQDGRILQGGAQGGQYRPRCAFEALDRRATEGTIAPASFAVTRVQAVTEEVVQWQPVQLASASLAGMDDGGAPMVHDGYHFWFGGNQPAVRRMTCYGVFAELQEVEPPTLEQIRYTLGGVAQLLVAP